MDQAKVYLAVAKKHHFWILIVIVVITAVVVWLKAANGLASKYEKDKQAITAAQDSVQKQQGADLVNSKFTEKVDKLHDGLKTSVFEAWKKLYDRQVVFFRWPDLSEYDANIDLGRLRPDEEIPDFAREIYNEKIVRQQWNELFEKAHLRKVKPKKQPGDADFDPEEESRGVEYEGLVVWPQDKRDAIGSRYFTVNARPSSTRIRLAQEDYWLFESLIEVINTVNAGAGDTLKAPIKEVQMMDVAQWAVAGSQEDDATIWTKEKSGAARSSSMGSADAMMGAGAMPGAGGMGAIGVNPGGAGGAPGAAAGGDAAGGAGAGSAEDDAIWLDNRYLDDKGQPLAGSGKQPFAEFKQVFVYMKLVMDQRRVPELVAACANAHLPIETRQIRVRMLKGDSGGGGFFPGSPGGGFGGMPMAGDPMGGAGMGGPMGMAGPMGGAGAMGPGMMGGMPGGMTPGAPGGMMGPDAGGMGGMGGGMPGMGGMGFGVGGLDGQGGGVETTIYDWIVELSGVIYLYNPADIAQLGTGAVGASEQRSFGVPTKPVRPPRGSSAAGGAALMGPMGPM